MTIARRAISAIIQLVKGASSEVWGAAKVLASGVSHAARIAVDAAKTLWRWWNTCVPRWVRWAVYGAVIGAGIALIVYFILGFGTAGVVAGSVAAGMHSGIGVVSAGSPFAVMQSAGATGLLWKAMMGAGALIGAAVGAVSSWFFGRKKG